MNYEQILSLPTASREYKKIINSRNLLQPNFSFEAAAASQGPVIPQECRSSVELNKLVQMLSDQVGALTAPISALLKKGKKTVSVLLKEEMSRTNISGLPKPPKFWLLTARELQLVAKN